MTAQTFTPIAFVHVSSDCCGQRREIPVHAHTTPEELNRLLRDARTISCDTCLGLLPLCVCGCPPIAHESDDVRAVGACLNHEDCTTFNARKELI